MLRIFYSSILSLILCVVSFSQPQDDKLANLRDKFSALKLRSAQHEQEVSVILSRPKIKQIKLELPDPIDFEKVVAVSPSINSTPIPPVPTFDEISQIENNNTLNTSDPILSDLVSDPSIPLGKESDNNSSIPSNSDLSEAYDDLYKPKIPKRTDGYYYGFGSGFTFAEDGAARTDTTNINFKSETGYILGVQFGRDFGGVRTEAEYNFISYDASEDFEVQTHDFMARLLFEFQIGERADIRSGLGMGVGFVNVEQASDYSGVGFSYDFNLGAGYRLSEDWSLCLDYRYFLTAAGDEYDRIKSHILALSATYDL